MDRNKKFYFGTNTKMYKTVQDTVFFLKELMEETSGLDGEKARLFVIPSFTALERAAEIVKNREIRIGAQNMGWEDRGPLTGEISPLMMEEAGVSLVMIGHSERRHILNETDEQENRKVLCALAHGFTVLLCIGETAEEKNARISNEVLKRQLTVGLRGVGVKETEKVWIAYEPVWSIGEGGCPAGADYVEEKHLVIKRVLGELFGEEAGEQIPVLYGGSVNNQNALPLSKTKGVDGLFIGRSAWDAKNFAKIIHGVLAGVKAHE